MLISACKRNRGGQSDRHQPAERLAGGRGNRQSSPSQHAVERHHQGHARQPQPFLDHAEDEIVLGLGQPIDGHVLGGLAREQAPPRPAQGIHPLGLVQVAGGWETGLVIGRRLIQQGRDPRLVLPAHAGPQHGASSNPAARRIARSTRRARRRRASRRAPGGRASPCPGRARSRPAPAAPVPRSAATAGRPVADGSGDTSSSAPAPARRPAWQTRRAETRRGPGESSDGSRGWAGRIVPPPAAPATPRTAGSSSGRARDTSAPRPRSGQSRPATTRRPVGRGNARCPGSLHSGRSPTSPKEPGGWRPPGWTMAIALPKLLPSPEGL